MPLVFVHGVATRESDSYNHNKKLRNQYFCDYLLKDLVKTPDPNSISNPYWGNMGAKLAWGGISLPDGHGQKFGWENAVATEVLVQFEYQKDMSVSGQTAITLAQISLPEYVDALWCAAAFVLPQTGGDEYTDEEQAAFAAAASMVFKYVESLQNAKPEWLAAAVDDNDFIDRLLKAAIDANGGIQTIQAFGGNLLRANIAARLKVAAQGLSNVAKTIAETIAGAGRTTANAVGGGVALAVTPLVRARRRYIHDTMSIFLGDMMVYLRTRGTPGNEGDIVETVADALENACNARSKDDDKLVIVAHSMGGNIAFDILTYFRPHIHCDALVTVGSQVGLFAELGMFTGIEEQVAAAKATQKPEPITLPKNIGCWLNVFGPNDLLGYSTERLFSGSQDFRYESPAHFLSAHSIYFYRPDFHRQLNQRLQIALSSKEQQVSDVVETNEGANK